MRILILCTGNSCRSQMAEGFLKSFNTRLEVNSAGTQPAVQANPNAVAAMKEVGIDISANKPKNVRTLLNDSFDFVITVCDHAKETCPLFSGHVRHRLHLGFEDPAEATGTFEEVMSVYRRVREEIREVFFKFYQEKIKSEIEIEAEELKAIVKGKYGGIALDSNEKQQSCCCGPSSCCDETTFTIFSEDYSKQPGYNQDADLDLGCGIPTEYAGIQEGDYVLDLGSGAGNDCFVARALVGKTGHVSGIDFTDEMIDKARANNKKMGFQNIDFIKGDIEQMPIPGHKFDVVVSNCVLNLVPDKSKAFAEIMRVLKKGGRLCVSDVVIKGNLPSAVKEDAVMYAGCVSGAIKMEDYLSIIEKTGFRNIRVHKQKPIIIPDDILRKYLTSNELEEFKKEGTGIFSITVSASTN